MISPFFCQYNTSLRLLFAEINSNALQIIPFSMIYFCLFFTGCCCYHFTSPAASQLWFPIPAYKIITPVLSNFNEHMFSLNRFEVVVIWGSAFLNYALAAGPELYLSERQGLILEASGMSIHPASHSGYFLPGAVFLRMRTSENGIDWGASLRSRFPCFTPKVWTFLCEAQVYALFQIPT
jgi:hypothetical protein